MLRRNDPAGGAKTPRMLANWKTRWSDAMRCLRWALVFLAGSQEQADRLAPPPRRVGVCFLLISAAGGAVLNFLYGQILHVTWDYYRILNWIIPSVLIALLFALVCYRPALTALLEMIPRVRRLPPWGRRACLMVLAGGICLAFNYGMGWQQDRSTLLGRPWQWLWPEPLFRVLVLSPMWGAWAMLALPQFHRPSDRTDAAARALAGAVNPISAAILLIAPLGGTLVYLRYLAPWHLLPPAVALAAALGLGSGLVHANGMNRRTLLAANAATQLLFLLAYVLVQR